MKQKRCPKCKKPMPTKPRKAMNPMTNGHKPFDPQCPECGKTDVE